MIVFGVDIGGTNTKIGFVSDNAKLLKFTTFKTVCNDATKLVEKIYTEYISLLKKAHLTEEDISCIGVGCAGWVNVQSGIVKGSKVFNNKTVKLKNLFENKFNKKTTVYNDANLMCMGEYFLNFSSCKNLLFCCFGTGVGGGVITDGKLYLGNNGMGTEIGHVVLKENGLTCNCGRHGCYQRYASISALIEVSKKLLKEDENVLKLCENDINNLVAENLFSLYEKNYTKVVQIVDNYLEDVCLGLLNLMNIFRPEVLLLGGGMAHAGKGILDKIKSICAREHFGNASAPKVKICFSKLSNKAGVLGAYFLFNNN